MSKKNDTKWFIEKAKLIHGGNFDYSKSVYINAKENIEIKCFKHNQTFYQTSNNHFNSKYPCEKCKKQHRRRLYADGIDKFIKKMSSKFGDTFDYSNTVYTRVYIYDPFLSLSLIIYLKLFYSINTLP